ncbi:efflux transporter outer membrane subunit [Dyella soli]|uniref:Efflux transporter outer membrane subunit n=1 Tax=Dyella soli TaxID=522319 RepID=A0A4R0YLN6_9GAMM|nr:efflux transporter outer membrane subunit [Dyella soli]TCI09656.1 efflux transporter outer membrane subunit [Dyella soli]
MRRAPIIAIVLGIATSGCTLTPDYTRPVNALANSSLANGPLDSDVPHSSEEAISGSWWRIYNDPLLNNLVDESLRSNTDMRVALANLRGASGGLDVASDAQLPQVEVGASTNYARDSAEEVLRPGPLPNERVYAVLGAVSYEVDLFGRVKRSIESADATVEAAKASLAATHIAVAAETVAAYLSVCSAGREATVTQRAIAIQVEETQLTRKLFAGGRTGSLDVTRSFTQEQSLRASLPPLEAAKRTSLNRLAVLTGQPVGNLPPAVVACNDEPKLDRVIPVGDGQSLIKRRPDIALAEHQLHRATAQYGVAKADLYPSISFGASGGSVGLLGHFNDDDTYKFSIGPLISWHFPNRRRALGQLTEAQAQIDAAFARFDAQVLVALDEVQSALAVYGHDLDRMSDLQMARSSAAKASSDARTLYAFGRGNYLSVLDADRQLTSLEQLIAAQQTKISGDQVQMFLALGGGWQE